MVLPIDTGNGDKSHQCNSSSPSVLLLLFGNLQFKSDRMCRVWKRVIYLVFLLFSTNWYLNSQQLSQTIKGTITEADTKIPVGYAAIIVTGTDPVVGTISDDAGNFSLKGVPVGRRSLKISCMGYEDVLISGIILGTGKEVCLNIELKPRLYEGEEVVIRNRKKKNNPVNTLSPVSTRRFSVEEANRYAGGFNDLSRMATAFAGVASFNGESNEIVIRGNSPRGLLWRVEGVEISNPNHFPRGDGASGGGISIITSDIILDSDFLTGAFSAEYGNGLSGVFDINLRKGNPEKHEYSLRLGAIGIEGMAEGPLVKKNQSSFLVNYRYSTLTLLEAAGFRIVDNTVVPAFQDLAFNVSVPTKRMGNFFLFGIGGMSTAGEKAVPDSAEWESGIDRIEESELHRMGAIGLRHLFHFPDNKTYLKTVALINGEQNLFLRDSLDRNYQFIRTYDEQIEYSTFRSSVMLNYKWNKRNLARGGVILSYQAFNLGNSILIPGSTQSIQLLNNEGSTFLLQSYILWKHYAWETVELVSGIHSIYFLVNKELTLEPRFGLRWRFSENQSFSLGFGLHSRVEPLSMYYYRITNTDGSYTIPNENLRSTKSYHNVAGYSFSFKNYYLIKTEIYFQYLYDIPVDITGASTFSTLNYRGGIETYSLGNQGSGYNYGLEFTLERYLNQGFYFLVTASVFDSKYKMPNSAFFNTAYNSHYLGNLLGGKEFTIGHSGNIIFSLNTRLYIKGGNRVTPIDLESSQETGKAVYVYEKSFTGKTSDFIRWDAGLELKFNRPNSALNITVDLQNMLNRKNVYTQYYDSESQSIKYMYGLPFIPVVNLKVEW